MVIPRYISVVVQLILFPIILKFNFALGVSTSITNTQFNKKYFKLTDMPPVIFFGRFPTSLMFNHNYNFYSIVSIIQKARMKYWLYLIQQCHFLLVKKWLKLSVIILIGGPHLFYALRFLINLYILMSSKLSSNLNAMINSLDFLHQSNYIQFLSQSGKW